MTNLAYRILAARESAGLSMAEAAEKADISRTGWWQVETGRSPPSLETARRIARVLGVSLDWLAGGNDKPVSTSP